MDKSKKELKKDYQRVHPPMGVFQIRNTANDRVFVGTSLNLPGAINSNRFQLNAGSHMNKELQTDWIKFGADSFVFEILDELSPTEGPKHDYRSDLAFLEEYWLERTEPYEDKGYNKRKKGTEERLKMIAQNRLSKGSENRDS